MTWHALRFLFVEAAVLVVAAAIVFAAWAAAHRGHRLVGIHPHSAWRVILAALIAAGAIWSFMRIYEGVLGDGRVEQADRRLHNTLRLFRSEPMHRFYASVSNLGSTAFAIPVALVLAVLFWKHRRRHEAAVFVLAVAGTEVLSIVLKYVVKRPRPPDAASLVSGPSFPSGHTLTAAGLYGILAYLLVRERPRRWWHAVAALALVTIAVLVPISRVYLGVHWPYDTIASVDLGVAWLACLTMFVRYGADGEERPAAATPLRSDAFAVATGVALVYAIVLAFVDVQRETRPALAPPRMTSAAVLQRFPPNTRRTSEDLIGGPMEPLSFIFAGSAEDVRRRFTRAGWSEAETPSVRGLGAELWAVIRDRPDPHGPATPAYYTEQPQDLTFERAGTASGSIRHRHHIRIWRWSYCMAPDCTLLWVATCSYDAGVKFVPKPYLVTHRIDPNVDHEREFVAATLHAAGASDLGTITVTGPATGKNAGGDAFTTDGRAHVIDLR